MPAYTQRRYPYRRRRAYAQRTYQQAPANVQPASQQREQVQQTQQQNAQPVDLPDNLKAELIKQLEVLRPLLQSIHDELRLVRQILNNLARAFNVQNEGNG